MRGRWLLLLLVSLLSILGAGQAQTLGVNGRQVDGLTLSLVPGVSYVPAGPFADALGARLFVDFGSELVTLELGGRIVVLPALQDPSAATNTTTIRVNGEVQDGRGAVYSDGQLYLPVSQVAESFLGYTAYVPEQSRVMVVLPRGRAVDLEAQQRGVSDRLILTLDANVPYSIFYNEPLGALEVTFERTDPRNVDDITGGRLFRRAALIEDRGRTRLRVTLDEGVDYQSYTVPKGRGYQLIVDLFEGGEEQAEELPPPLVVIDPGHGGSDVGMTLAEGTESARTLELATELTQLLERRGVRVQLSRSGDNDVPLETRSGMGVGADAFLSIHVHPSPNGAASIYYLADARSDGSLDLAIRQNAQAELGDVTDVLRRRLLLNLVPDVEVGMRYAQAVQAELVAAGLRVGEPEPAPLAVLSGAAGRGMLIELPASVRGSSAVVEALADVIADFLQRGAAQR